MFATWEILIQNYYPNDFFDGSYMFAELVKHTYKTK